MYHENIKYHTVSTRENVPALIVNSGGREFPLHSRMYPTKESKSFEKMFEPERYDTVLILGTGLGYHLIGIEPLITKYRKVILIDIISGIESEILKNEKTSFLCKNENVYFLTGMTLDYIEEKLHKLIDMENTRGISVLDHPASIRVFDSYYTGVRAVIENIINRKAASGATKKAFGTMYLKNAVKNLEQIHRFGSVSDLFGNFSPYHALVIASGPSLEYHISSILEHRECFFIIAVDSAVPVLLERGIIPDFMISVDPQAYICEHLLGCDLSLVFSVFSITSSSHAVSIFTGDMTAGRVLLSFNSHPLSQVIDQLYNEPAGSVDSATGSVAGDAVNLAYRLGFRKIGLLGCDFSFSDYVIYSRGTAYQRRYSKIFQNRFQNAETSNFNYIMKSSRGYKCCGRFSRRSFDQYRIALEDFIRQQGIKNLYSINGKGIPLKGAPETEFREFLKGSETCKTDRAGYIRNLISGSDHDLQAVSPKEVRDFLLQKSVFAEFVKASAGADVSDRMKGKIYRIIKKTVSTQLSK